MPPRKTCASAVVAFCFTTTFKPYYSSIFGTTLVALSMLTTSRLVPLVFHMLPHLLLSSVHSPICALVCLLSYLCFHLCAPAFLPRDAMFHLFLFTPFGVPCRCNTLCTPAAGSPGLRRNCKQLNEQHVANCYWLRPQPVPTAFSASSSACVQRPGPSATKPISE